jgi:hypothetical protein
MHDWNSNATERDSKPGPADSFRLGPLEPFHAPIGVGFDLPRFGDIDLRQPARIPTHTALKRRLHSSRSLQLPRCPTAGLPGKTTPQCELAGLRGDDKVTFGIIPNKGKESADEHNWPSMIVERSCMNLAYVYRQMRALAVGTPLLLSLSLGGSSSTAGSPLMDTRAEAPKPPQASSYLPVEVLPAPRESPTMTPDERSKIQKELMAARDRHLTAAKADGVRSRKPKGSGD